MDQETVPRERKIPPNSRVARRLDFGGDNFEADLDNFINLTTEVVQTYSERYNFDFDNEIAFCGRYVWSKSDKRTGWLTMAVKEQKDGNEMNQSTAVVTADISPTDTRTVAAAAEKTPRRHSAATAAAACDRVLRKREPRDDKTSEKKKMPRDDKTSKKRKMQDAGDDKKTRKSQVKKRLTME